MCHAYQVDRYTILYTIRSENLFIFEDSSGEDEALIIFRELRVLVGDSLLELFDSCIRIYRDRELDIRRTFDGDGELV